MSGKLIVIEGSDGVGKSTITANLKQKIRYDKDLKVAFLRQPSKYRNEISNTDPSNWLRMLYLFMKDREEQYPALMELMLSGYHILMDRYYHSSCVYQNISSKVGSEVIYHAHGPFILKPDLTIILDASDVVVEKRLKERVVEDGIDNFEKNITFRQAVRDCYRELSFSKDTFKECVLVSNEGSVTETINEIWSYLGPLFGLKK